MKVKDAAKLAQEIVNYIYGDEKLGRLFQTWGKADAARAVANEVCKITSPNGFPMVLNGSDWMFVAEAVNQGIDAHLGGFTRSTFDDSTGKVVIHPEEMGTLLGRLSDLIVEQSNREYTDAGGPDDFEPSDELSEREGFVASIIEVLCRKEEE